MVNTNRVQHGRADGADQILEDYWGTVRTLRPFASYFMLNLSCPNTADGREFFGEATLLRELLHGVEELVDETPVLLKISPDIDEASIDRLLHSVGPFSMVRGFMFNLSPADERD